jgi:hypothetical protein
MRERNLPQIFANYENCFATFAISKFRQDEHFQFVCLFIFSFLFLILRGLSHEIDFNNVDKN